MDIKTILISYLITNAICAGVIWALYSQNHKIFNGLGFWLAAYLMQFAGLVLVILQNYLPDFIASVMGSAFFVVVMILLYTGLERFLGKHSPQTRNYVLFVLFISVHTYFLFVHPNISLRSITLSLTLFLICTQLIWLLFRRTDVEMRPVVRDTGFVIAAHGMVNLVYAGVNLTMIMKGLNLQSDQFESIVLTAYQMLFILLTFNLFLMVNRRLNMELEKDLAELKQAEEALKQSEKLYRQMFIEHSAVKLLIDPSNGSIVQANSAAAQFYGYTVKELQAMNISQINLLSREAIAEAMKEAHQRKTNYFVFQHCLASGEIRDVEVHSAPIKFGERELLYAIIHDITERKQAEAALHASETSMRALLENVKDVFARYDLNLRYQYISPLVQKFMDATPESFIGKTHREAGFPEDKAEFFDASLRKVIETKNPIDVEFAIQGPNGETIQQTRVYPEFDEKGEVISVVTVTSDITERKRADEELRESESLYESLVNQLPQSLYRIALDGKVLFINKTYQQNLGVPLEDILGKIAYDLSPEDKALQYREEDAQVIASGKPLKLIDENKSPVTGQISYNEGIKIPIFDKDGNVRGIQGVFYDITERKLADEKLRESEKRFRQLILSAPDVVFLVDQEGKITFANMEATNLLGYTPDEFIGMAVEQLIPPELRNGHIAERAKYMSDPHTRIMGAQLNLFATHKDGNQIPVDIKLSPVQMDAGTQVIAFMRDITERRQTEEKLIKAKEAAEESEARFRKSLESSPTPMVVADHAGKLIFLNQNFIETYGYTLQDIPSIEQWMFHAYPDPEYRNSYLQLWEQDSEYAIKNNTATPLREYLVTCKSGEVKTVAILAFFEKDLIIGHFLDISERKRAEEALRLEQAFVNNALDNQQDTFFLFDFTSGKALRWNRAFREISGYSDEEIAALRAPISYYSAEDLTRENAVIQRVMQGEPASIVMNLICKDGRKITTEYQAAPLKDENGEYRYIIAIGRDITERVRAEGELRTTNATLQTQFNEINTLKETLQEQVIRDPLTNLHNRRYLDEMLEHEVARANRENYPIGVMMIDIDHFKKFNDTYGHSMGDEVLKALSSLLVESIRQGDIACRYGGEEFLIVMIGAHKMDVERRAEGICRDFNKLRICFEGQELSATVSIGIAFYPRHGTEIQKVISMADAAMYQAKQDGRNKIHVWGSEK